VASLKDDPLSPERIAQALRASSLRAAVGPLPPVHSIRVHHPEDDVPIPEGSVAVVKPQDAFALGQMMVAVDILKRADQATGRDGYYYQPIHPLSAIGQLVMRLNQELKRLQKRMTYGGRKGRRAERRWRQLRKAFEVPND
jgi:hypothetical protein